MDFTTQPSHLKEDKDLGPDDSISVVATSSTSGSQSSTVNINTPMTSSASKSPPNRSSNIPHITRHSAPGPDFTYILVSNTKDEKRALAIVEGGLKLIRVPELSSNPALLNLAQAKTFAGACNWHWHCRELDGWLGFRNAATGLWLGSYSTGHIEGFKVALLDAARPCLGPDAQFCVRKAKDAGGYMLLKRVDVKETGYFSSVTTVKLWPVIDLHALNIETTHLQKRGSAWEFVEVDLDAQSGTKMDEKRND